MDYNWKEIDYNKQKWIVINKKNKKLNALNNNYCSEAYPEKKAFTKTIVIKRRITKILCTFSTH